MTTYAWPSWGVSAFELRVVSNTRTFTSPYGSSTQVVDLLGERWQARIDLTLTTDPIEASAREAFWDRLRGGVNRISLYHLRRPQPLGTLRGGGVVATWKNSSNVTAIWKNNAAQNATWTGGDPVVHADIPQLASTGVIRCQPGKTLLAGDLFSLAGQLVRQLVNTSANGSGLMNIEFTPRARQLIPASTDVVWDHPTANFMVKGDVPTAWQPGYAEGASLELIETP